MKGVKVSLLLALLMALSSVFSQTAPVLRSERFKHYVDSFNAVDTELYPGFISNRDAWNFLDKNIPLFECPDKDIERTYYFRWWSYRKHIKKTPEGFVITEFLPHVPWAGEYDGISCAAGLHFYEGRWLHDRTFLDDYARYWFDGKAEPRTYSFWAADAIYNFCLVSDHFALADSLLPALIRNFAQWDKTNLDSNGLYWQNDGSDGMEVSICGRRDEGNGYRATINSYMYGDAMAIARLALRTGQKAIADSFVAKATAIKRNVQRELWDASASFFKVMYRNDSKTRCSAKELHGYTPWYFNLPDRQFDTAWKFVMDTTCFFAPYGLTTAQRNHPDFQISYQGHECQWNGPSWPYATSITLTALANLLNAGSQQVIDKQDYLTLLQQYARSHRLIRPNGTAVPWIDEDLNPFTGDWIARTRLANWENGSWSQEKGGMERGKDYNHSTFCDLVITGLVGLRPQNSDTLVINPLLPANKWDYFCLDHVAYHGRKITVAYDKSGTRYHLGKGFNVYVDGVKKAGAPQLKKLTIVL